LQETAGWSVGLSEMAPLTDPLADTTPRQVH
jgi:hypothetical protein